MYMHEACSMAFAEQRKINIIKRGIYTFYPSFFCVNRRYAEFNIYRLVDVYGTME